MKKSLCRQKARTFLIRQQLEERKTTSQVGRHLQMFIVEHSMNKN